MTHNKKKLPNVNALIVRVKNIALFVFRILIGYLHEISTYHIFAAIIVFVLIVITGNLFTKSGLILAIGLIVFVFLRYLTKIFEN